MLPDEHQRGIRQVSPHARQDIAEEGFGGGRVRRVGVVADEQQRVRLGARVARFRRGEADIERLIASISGAYANEVVPA